MKLSELVAFLQEDLKAHGDIPVCYDHIAMGLMLVSRRPAVLVSTQAERHCGVEVGGRYLDLKAMVRV